MRFKNEFIVCKDHPNKRAAYLSQKDQCDCDLGKLIGEKFDYRLVTDSAIEEEMERHCLEIEAFPIDKWVAFKQKLFSGFIDDDYEGAGKVLELIKELESFGKPAGEAKELNQQQ